MRRAGPDSSPAAMTLHRDLMLDLAGSIERGLLRAGEKLPSVRAMQRQRGISQATVLHAYYQLEQRGYVESRPRSGYLVSTRWQALPPRETPAARTRKRSVPVKVSDLVFEILDGARHRSLLPLGSAFPSPLLFPLDKLGAALARSARQLDPWATVTDLPPGSWELRRHIARRYLAAGVKVDVDDILVTHGAMEALNLSLQAVTKPGDIVAIESPAFYAALQAIERLGLRAVEVPTDPRDGVDLDALRRILDTQKVHACWFMTTYQNPLGALMPAARKRELVALLAAREIPLVEDDVYAELYHGEQAPKPAKAYDRDGFVLHCGSFSKSLAPGYRIGWVAAGRYARSVERLKLTTSLATSVPAQVALAEYLKGATYDTHLRRLRRTLREQKNAMRAAIAEHFPRGTRVADPDGGYFLWVELPRGGDALALQRRAMQAGIGVSPGPMFSPDGTRFRHALRLNCGHPWTTELQTGIATLGRLAAGT
jgi:DNA-binding transcriptional MocR family regulator